MAISDTVTLTVSMAIRCFVAVTQGPTSETTAIFQPHAHEASPAGSPRCILSFYFTHIDEGDVMNSQHNRPRLINWLGYFAIGLLLILPLSVLTIRSGQWQLGLPLYAIACFGSVLLLILAIVLLLRSRFTPWRKDILLRALFALPGAALLLALTSGGNHPMIHDISTDTADPPTFTVAAATARGRVQHSRDRSRA